MTVLPVRLHIGAFSHLVRVLDVTVGEVRWTPAADLVTDVDTRRHEDREDGEDVHGEATVETVTEAVPTPRPGVLHVAKGHEQLIHLRRLVGSESVSTVERLASRSSDQDFTAEFFQR